MTWTRYELKTAKLAPLRPILLQRGYKLLPTSQEAWLVIGLGNLVVRENYGVWNEKNLRGNTFDFFIFTNEIDQLQPISLCFWLFF